MPARCKKCLEYKAGRCQLVIDKGKCSDRITAHSCMRPSEIRIDTEPQGTGKRGGSEPAEEKARPAAREGR